MSMFYPNFLTLILLIFSSLNFCHVLKKIIVKEIKENDKEFNITPRELLWFFYFEKQDFPKYKNRDSDPFF